jgi:hypothetical protein
MAAVAPVLRQGPIHWGNAGGRAVIAEVWRFPASTAADTVSNFVAQFLEEIIAVIGNVQFTAPAINANGATITTITTLDTIAASNFVDVIFIGFARRVHSGGLA